jgi:hypothetical protein
MTRCVAQVEPPWVPVTSLGEACAAGDIRSIAHLLDNGASVNDFIVSGSPNALPHPRLHGFSVIDSWRRLYHTHYSLCMWRWCAPTLVQMILHHTTRGPLRIVAAIFAQPIENGDGRTPLAFAAMNGHLEAVRLLLHRGASVNTGRVSCDGARVRGIRIVLNPCVSFLCVGLSARYKNESAS